MKQYIAEKREWMRRCAIGAFAILLMTAGSTALGDLPRPAATFAKGVVFTVSGYTGESALQNFPVLVRIAEHDLAAGTGINGFYYSDLQNASPL